MRKTIVPFLAIITIPTSILAMFGITGIDRTQNGAVVTFLAALCSSIITFYFSGKFRDDDREE